MKSARDLANALSSGALKAELNIAGGLLVVDLDAQGHATGRCAGDARLLSELGLATAPRASEDIAERIHPEFSRALRKALEACRSPNETVVHIVPSLRNGTKIFLELTVVARWHDDDVRPAAYCLTVRDASRSMAQRWMLDRLAQVATRTSNLVVITDARRRIEWVNDAFTAVSGYSLDEARGRLPGELLQFEGTDPETVSRIRRALDAHLPIQAEILNRGKSGHQYWLLLDIQPLLDARGQLDGFVAVQMDITEDKQRGARLTELAQQAELARSTLLSAVDALPDGFALYDADERLLFCNDRYRTLDPGSEDILRPGVSLASVFQHEVMRGIYPAARGCEQAWLAKTLDAIHSNDEWSTEFEVADGRWIRGVKRRGPNRRLIALRSDITQLKQAERSAVLQRVTAMDASHDGIATTDSAGRLVYINPALAHRAGAASEQPWVGRAWCDLFDEDNRDATIEAAHKALASHGFWRGHLRSRGNPERMHDQEVTLTRAPDNTLVLISRDISERLRYEAERSRLNEVVVFERVAHEARLERALIETKRLHERDRQLREASEMLLKAMQRLSAAEDLADGPAHLLRQLAESLDTRCAALLPLDSGGELLCIEQPQWWHAISQQADLVAYLAHKPRRLIGDLSALALLQPLASPGQHGGLRWIFSARVEPARSRYLLIVGGGHASTPAPGKSRIFVRFIPLLAEALRRRDDHLRARKLERDLQQAHKMESLGTLAGGIAHEINTPMQFISDNLHFLRDAFAELVAALESGDSRGAAKPGSELAYVLKEVPLALEQSLAGSRRVAELVEAIRTFAYPELARIESIHLRGMLEHCLVITRSAWKHDVTVSLDCAQEVAPIQGSPGQISQVFINLTTNACDAARMTQRAGGGIVRLSLVASDDEVVIHVDDNGPGVPVGLRDRIFDPFFTTKSVGKGTGQGLGISRSIVERHGGRIDLEDSPLGGARFTVRFSTRGLIAEPIAALDPCPVRAEVNGGDT